MTTLYHKQGRLISSPTYFHKTVNDKLFYKHVLIRASGQVDCVG